MKKLLYKEQSIRFEIDHKKALPKFLTVKTILDDVSIDILSEDPAEQLKQHYIKDYKKTLNMLSDDVCLVNVGKQGIVYRVQNSLVELEELCPLKVYSDVKEYDKFIDAKYNKYTSDPELIAWTEKIDKFHEMAKELKVYSLGELQIYGYNYRTRMYVPGDLKRRYEMEHPKVSV